MIDFSLRGGFDPLMMACERNDLEYVKVLIPHSKIDHKNERGETCLSVAVKLGYEDIVRELVCCRADVNCQNKAGQSLVYIASWCNHIEILRVLIQAGADINLPDNRQWTPLMVAAYSGYLSIVLELLKNGADSEKKDCFGKKAIDRAKNSEIIESLSGIFYEQNYPKRSQKSMNMSFSVSKFLNDKKRGAPVHQKKPISRSLSAINIKPPPMTLDVIQRRDMRGLIDDRMKIISKAYEFHVFQEWNIIMSTYIEEELQKAQASLLSQQEICVKKAAKNLMPRLKAQLGLLVEKSVSRLGSEKKNVQVSVNDVVKSEDIEEFYRFKFDKVSKELTENLTESIINRLKLDMNELQETVIHGISSQVQREFLRLSEEF